MLQGVSLGSGDRGDPVSSRASFGKLCNFGLKTAWSTTRWHALVVPFLSTEPTCQLNILGLDGYSLSMNGRQIGILKEPAKDKSTSAGRRGSTRKTSAPDQVDLGGLLKRQDGGCLET